MNYRTWRTYLADTMEHLSLTQAEAIAHIDGVLRAKRFPSKWKYHAVRISDEAINATRHSLATFDAFTQALDNEMNAIEADIKHDTNRPLFGGGPVTRPRVLLRYTRARLFMTKQRHPVEAIVRKRGWIKPDEHECDDY